MTERKRFLLIIVLVFFGYLFYYYQSDFKDALKLRFKNFTDRGMSASSLMQSVTNNTPNQKIQIVDEESFTIDVVSKSTPAVVSVVRKDVFYDLKTGPVKQENSIGTGFVINGKEGIILTNKHVVDDEKVSYSVVLGSGTKQYAVSQISRDPLNDFSILKLDLNGDTLPELPLGDSGALKIGQTVIAIGNALGEFGNSVTKGIVSGLNRGIMAQSDYFGNAEYLENVIQTDAALNPGNSGGPLLNLEGQVIGINVAISQGAQNIGFSIPINTLKPAIEQFKQKGKISRPYLGVEYRIITKDIAEARSLPIGAFVENVVPSSPAEKAGVRSGDIIIKINDVRLDDGENTLSKVVSIQQVGQTISLTVDRDGKEVKLNAKLEDSAK